MWHGASLASRGQPIIPTGPRAAGSPRACGPVSNASCSHLRTWTAEMTSEANVAADPRAPVNSHQISGGRSWPRSVPRPAQGSDAILHYVEEVRRVPLLGAEEERALGFAAAEVMRRLGAGSSRATSASSSPSPVAIWAAVCRWPIYPGRQPRAHSSGGQVRSLARVQVLHVCLSLDCEGNRPGTRWYRTRGAVARQGSRFIAGHEAHRDVAHE